LVLVELELQEILEQILDLCLHQQEMVVHLLLVLLYLYQVVEQEQDIMGLEIVLQMLQVEVVVFQIVVELGLTMEIMVVLVTQVEIDKVVAVVVPIVQALLEMLELTVVLEHKFQQHLEIQTQRLDQLVVV
jgi:hypothetical protein